ncbi:hypothetical protein IT881_08760 [Erythrobacter sp. A30-3]|nr:hypothetical protein IT881_08760 [Erythrobacter sp. A30-3]
MAIDPDRAIFAQRELSWQEALDNTVMAEQPLARSIELESVLKASGAAFLAAEILNDNDEVSQVSSFDVDGVEAITAASFAGSPPRFDAHFAGLGSEDGIVLRTIEVTVDYNENSTSIIGKGQV